MPAIISKNMQPLYGGLLCFVSIVISACAVTLPQTVYIRDPELPDYQIGSHRIADPIDLFVEPRISTLMTKLTPRSDTEVFPEISVIVGPALETALLALTRQHFSEASVVQTYADRPTLSYSLLAYKPDVTVVHGKFRTQLDVSARLALQVTVRSARGKDVFSTTAIGTSHISDTKFSPGKEPMETTQLVEVVTRNAIIDAMYEISKIFGNSGESILTDVRNSETAPSPAIETFDDVVLYLRTQSDGPN